MTFQLHYTVELSIFFQYDYLNIILLLFYFSDILSLWWEREKEKEKEKEKEREKWLKKESVGNEK
jgi:hypothetical protein